MKLNKAILSLNLTLLSSSEIKEVLRPYSLDEATQKKVDQLIYTKESIESFKHQESMLVKEIIGDLFQKGDRK